jgi:uncharacterized protein YjdB
VLDPAADTDGDGYPDGWELENGYDPTDPDDHPDYEGNPTLDTDGDGYPDDWELENGYDPTDPDDHPDHEGNPTLDTDGDGYPDGWELENGYDPTDPNSPYPGGYVAVTGISLNPTSLALAKDATQTLTPTVLPADATNKAVTWTTSNSSVATVSAAGKVTAKAAGSATITATTQDGNYTAACTVTVTVTVAATGISLNQITLPLEKDASYILTATVSPADATNKAVTWTTNNSSVATVVDGRVTGKATGQATITATTHNGKTASCPVSVSVTIPVTSVTVDPPSLTVDLKEYVYPNYAFYAIVSPTNATSRMATWTISSSSLASNATISKSGLVNIGSNAYAGMKLTVTATMANGVKGTATITIK